MIIGSDYHSDNTKSFSQFALQICLATGPRFEQSYFALNIRGQLLGDITNLSVSTVCPFFLDKFVLGEGEQKLGNSLVILSKKITLKHSF